ncbi:TonB-dependent receptor [Muricauda sp. 334s03]|uniref:TonB-dependent receptor n=1 Tax=Flagellimonas yonaguniensis TaxID=3031325 RepID=A0ABT5Y236_9FLAO|nr:TonB-dependent receptor [[Muricauda] yonaguniensis]MDF0717132.1 TonB-dependent receptor [[Muricauda] yonaguniensis]
MKTVMMLWAFNFFALPVQAKPENYPNISLQQDHIGLVAIFDRIEQQASVSFIYNSEVKNIEHRINVNYQNRPLTSVMDHLAQRYGLGYKIQNSNITVYIDRRTPIPAQRTIRGSVKDDAGQPLMGANVRVLGSDKGMITDFDGNFQIQTFTGDILEFSYIGMETQTYTVQNGIDNISIQLKANNQQLDEVVVIGYGEKTLESLSAAVSKVDVGALAERPLSNAAVALQGLTPGLTITRSNGRPTDTPNINIRGFTSINGGEPLIIIDGVEGDINDINPSDIENISVLKDAGAAAIYGARASFGVVLITTKQARKGDLKVNLDITTAVSQVTTNTDFVIDPYEAIQIADTFFQASSGASYSGYTEADYTALQEVSANPSLARVVTDTRNGREQYIHYAKTNWWNTFFRESRPSQIYNASISGGSEKLKGYFSYRNYREVGILKVQEDLFKKENYRAKVEFKLNDWITVSDNMQFNRFDDLQYGGYRGGWHGNYWNYLVYNHAMPWYSPTNPDGTYFYRSELNNYAAGDGLYASLLHGKSKQETEDSEFSNIITATLTPVDGLSIKASYAYRKMNQNIYQRSTLVPWSIYVDDIQTMSSDKLTEFNTSADYDAFNIYADYNRRFGKHHIDVMAGFGQESMYSKTIQASTQGLISDDLNSLGLGTTADDATGSAYEWALQGVYSRISYDYDSKYFLELNGRYDGTSRFPLDFRWGFFPSVSAAWALHNENFMESLNPTLSRLKLRASYGSLGNQEDSPYAYQPVLSRSVNEAFSLNGSPLESISSPALNPVEITWEEVRTLDFGVDLGFFKNRLTANFDWFKRETLGMLTAGQVLPATLGASAPKENAADLETKGFELSLGYNNSFNVGGSPFQLSVSAGLSNSETKITKFDNPENLLNSFYEGMVIGDLWGYHVEGLFQTEEEVAAHVDQSYVSARISSRGGLQPGDVKYADLNGDGVVDAGTNTLDDPGDQKIVGNVAPKYLYNFRVSTSWKGFDLSAFFQGVGKQDWYPGYNSQLFWGPYSRPYASFVRKDLANNIWSADNPDGYYPRGFGYIALSGRNSLRNTNDRYLQDISYLRLKNLTFGYNLPQSVLDKTPFGKVRVYLSGENILTFTKLTDYIDPEIASNQVNLNSPSGSYTYDSRGQEAPMSKTYSLGVSIQF